MTRFQGSVWGHKPKQAANPQNGLFTDVKGREALKLPRRPGGESGLLETFNWDFADLWGQFLGQGRG